MVTFVCSQTPGTATRGAARTTMRLAVVALSYLLIAWAFHAGAINAFTNLIGGGDGFIQGLASKTFATSFSSWNPYVQSGKFVYADVLYQSFYPPSLLILSIFPNTFGFNLYLLVHYALAGLFLYLYLGSLRLTPYSAFVGGLIFMVSGFMTAHKGHEYIVCAAIWLPLTLYFIHQYAEHLRIVDLGYAAVPVAFSILAGFPQITLYSTLLVLAYLPFCVAGSPLLRGWKTKLGHTAISAAMILGIGGLLGCLPLFAVAESLPYLTREHLTYDAFTSDNFPPWHLFTFFIPDLFGGVDRHVPIYAPNTTVYVAEVYGYIGLLPLTMAMAGVAAPRTATREVRFWLAVAAAGLLFSFGGTTLIYRLLFHVPVYNLFRVPARNLFEVNFALSVMAAIGLDFLLRQNMAAHPQIAQLVRRTMVRISVLFAGAILAAGTLRAVAEGWFLPFVKVPDSAALNYYYTFGTAKAFMVRNLSWNSPTMIFPLLFFALTVGILISLFRRRLRSATLIAIPLLIVADSFLASHRMYDNPSTELVYRRTGRPELDFLNARQFDRAHYRLFPVDFDLGSISRLTSTYHLASAYPYPLLNMFNGLSVINDYGPFWLKRYQAVTGFSAGGGMPLENLQNYKMLSLLGTRYLMVLSSETRRFLEHVTLDSTKSDGPVNAFPAVTVTSNGITIFENPNALARVRFARHITPARNLDEAISLMSLPGFDPSDEAVVEGIESDGPTAPGNILNERLENTRLAWDVETSGRSFLIMADSFFPGWTATVDGRRVPIYAVYGCVRGISIESAGRHHVEFLFVPPGLHIALACTGVGLLFLGVVWLGHRTGRLKQLTFGRCSQS
jgi:Bacterial membrane protein YfhO